MQLATSIALVLIAPMAHAQPVKTPYTQPHRTIVEVATPVGPVKTPYGQPHKAAVDIVNLVGPVKTPYWQPHSKVAPAATVGTLRAV